jgi:hypothetical protein
VRYHSNIKPVIKGSGKGKADSVKRIHQACPSKKPPQNGIKSRLNAAFFLQNVPVTVFAPSSNDFKQAIYGLPPPIMACRLLPTIWSTLQTI